VGSVLNGVQGIINQLLGGFADVALPGDMGSQQRGNESTRENGATGRTGLMEMLTNPLALGVGLLAAWGVAGYFDVVDGPVETVREVF
jgi:hypothetical protein